MHDPLGSDFALTALSGSEVRIVANPPPGSATGSTACEFQRLAGGSWIVVKPFSGIYVFVEDGLIQNTANSYRIRFQNGDGVATAPSPSSDVATGPPPAPSPTGLSGIALTPYSIQWSWDNFSGAVGFEIHDAAHNVKGTTGAGVLSFMETGLSENTLVSRHIHAVIGGWLSAPSLPFARYTLVHDALTSDFTLNPLATDSIDVAVLQPPQGAESLTGCLIERSSDGSSWTAIKPFSNVYIAHDTGLTRSTPYFYRVTFRDGDGVAGLPSPSRSAITLSVARPVITTASKKTRNRNTAVQGIADPGASVTIVFNGVADGTVVAGAGGLWSYAASTKNEGLYQVIARATDGISQSPDSNGISIQIDLTPPPSPTRVRTTGYANAIDVEWDPSVAPDLAGYLIYRREVGTTTWSVLNTKLVVGTKYRDTTAVQGKQYSFKVVALDDSEND